MATISGATGTTCTVDGLYKASDRKAQYLVLYTKDQVFLPFPGGTGKKNCTWYRVTGTQVATTVSDNDGIVTTKDDGGFTGVVAVG